VISKWQFGKDVESGGHDIIRSPIEQLPRGTEETHRWPEVHMQVSKTTYGCDTQVLHPMRITDAEDVEGNMWT